MKPTQKLNIVFTMMFICASAYAVDTTKVSSGKYIYSYQVSEQSEKNNQFVAINGKNVFEGSYSSFTEDIGEDCKEDCLWYKFKATDSEELQVVSLVGNMASVLVNRSSERAGMAHPSHDIHIITKRLGQDGSIEVVTLTDIFSKNEIVKAFVSDPYIKKKYPLLSVEIFEKILSGTISQYSDNQWYGLSPDLLQEFGIDHVKNGKLAVRIFLPREAEVELTGVQIGIYLTPSKELLQDAISSEKNGLLMSKMWQQ